MNLVVVDGYSFKAATDAVGVSSRSLREWHEKLAPKPEACGEDVGGSEADDAAGEVNDHVDNFSGEDDGAILLVAETRMDQTRNVC